ncbi:DUF5672 family protein [Pedobacter sp. MW01-1-1]|uniref:DUF5672 family protein n=1 Tax=Pedobacter sp. MW01-1-1 TaxID=3383027 RepID=UPI003FEF0F51
MKPPVKFNDNPTAIITIPIYRAEPTEAEKASLLQLFKTLGKHDICLFTHKELDIYAYENILVEYKFSIKYFKKNYFTNIQGYNSLLLNKYFYKQFKQYDYLLIYQLDAWVFSDELLFWCSQDFDYIGAPWFSSDNPKNSLPHFMGIGNGGFSLRKVKSHIKVLSKFSYLISPVYLLSQFFKKPSMTSIIEILRKLTITNNTHSFFGKNNWHEDVFWGKIIQKKYLWFKAPDMFTAAKFATETNSEKLYQISSKLPFGCHAWEKYDVLFWRNHIDFNTNKDL